MASRFDPFTTNLPVTDILEELKQQLGRQNAVILAAPPGAGKSTLVPLALLDEPWLGGKKILMLEPRRLAASSIAGRMSQLLGEEVGETVGYRVRFEKKTGSSTRIEVLTEGILTRMLQNDNALEDTGLIIFDEFHERSIHADTGLALARQVQEVLRPDLRLLVMSATLDLARLAEMLGAPVVESPGRAHPVEVIYTGEQDLLQLPELCSRTVLRAVREQEGDVLVFLPGQAEISKCQRLLETRPAGCVIYPLYGQLTRGEQQAALSPDPGGRRKIVLATSIAETSLTIEGVRIVVDSGFTRKSSFDPVTGLSGLKTVMISTDSADQRAGRAGRLGPGVCYRMWSVATMQRMLPFRIPEILENDLAPLSLDLYTWGVDEVSSLCWLDEPPAAALAGAGKLLESLGAVKVGKLTPHGRAISKLPAHPRIANLLVRAGEQDALSLAADVAALLEERDPLNYAVAGADMNLRIEELRRNRSLQKDRYPWDRIERSAAAYRKLMRTGMDNSAVDHFITGLLLAHAFPERIASAKAGVPGQFLLAGGQTAMLHQDDGLAREQWLSIANLDAQKGQAKIFLAAPLDPGNLIHLAEERENIRWDNRKGELLATLDLRIGSAVIASKPVTAPDPVQLASVISETIRSYGRSLLKFNAETEEWQNRVLSLRHWNGDENWPDVSTESLLNHNEDWLAPYFSNLRKAEDFGKIDLAGVLHHSLSYEQQILLGRLAPAALTVPSGSMIGLTYSPYGDDPVMAVRLQELFGMLDTPLVNDGKRKVVLHLLSPGYKPVQVTTDLRSFWSTTYFEVRKELRRRYPKHSWPENPLEAKAVRGVRRSSK